MTAEQPYAVLSTTTVCIKDASTTREVTKVVPAEADGVLRIVDFTIVPTSVYDASEGFLRRSIAQKFGAVNHRVSVSCQDDEKLDWLYIEVERPTDAIGRIKGLEITDGSRKNHTLNFNLTACRKLCPERPIGTSQRDAVSGKLTRSAV